MADSFEDKAQEVAVLAKGSAVMGIPVPLFGFVVAFCGALAFMVSYWAGIPLGALALLGLYKMHENDPQAFDVWSDRIRSQMRVWRAGLSATRRIVLVKKERTE